MFLCVNYGGIDIFLLSEKTNDGNIVAFGLFGSPAWAEWEGGLGGLPETLGRTVWQLLAEIR